MVNFDEIELLFSDLLQATSSEFTNLERSEVQSFIDVGEYGLALETVIDIYEEEKKSASTIVVGLLKQLALAMSMERTQLLNRIKRMEKGI